MKSIKNSLLFFLLSLLSLTGYTQSGPGGVGNSTSNVLWLKADANVYSDLGTTPASNGNLVEQWNDKSGHANNAIQLTSANRPWYVTNIVNGLPALRFTGDTYIDAGALGIAGTGGFTFIFVLKDTAYTAGTMSDGSGDYILDRTTATSELTSLKITNTNKYGFQKRDDSGGGLGGPVSTTSVNTSAFQVIDYMRERGTAYRLFMNGTLESSVADGDGNLTPPNPRIGRHATTANNGIKGYIAEVIAYNYRVNSAQINILDSYLAAKYGMTVSDNKYAYGSTYGHDVAGIGRVDASNINTDAQSGSLLEVNSASSLGNGDYLLFGHDNASISSWTTSEAPDAGTNIKRISREWRLNVTDGGGGDGVGTVKFVIDTTLLPARTSGYSKYVLMVDADGDFSSGASLYEMSSPGSNNYFETASNIAINNGDYVSIAEIRPTIQFTSTTSSGFEPSNASIAVSLNYIAKNAVNVTYNTADGTAIAPGDYTAVSGGSFTIPAGSKSANLTVTVINDVIVENDETFTVTLSSPTGGVNLGTNTVNTYTIHDDDNSRKIYFTASGSSGSESVSPVSITVTIDAAQIDAVNPTSVDYSVTGGTATGGGVDYTLLGSGTATIAPNTQTTTISLSVNDDALYESNETVIISLTNPVNGNLSSTNPIVYTYTILDNDSPPVIQFTSTSSSGSESVTSVNFQVSQNVVSGLASSVNYTVTGTATGGGVDYSLANGTLTIPAGSTSANISATIIDDSQVELSETIVITLSGPVNSTLGANTVYTYTIIDNDIFGYTGPGGVGNSGNNKLWLRADANVYSDAGTTLATDGSSVWQWNDQSGNGNNAAQVTASRQPVYNTGIVNSLPALNFNGSRYIDAGSLGISGSGGFTYFVVLRPTTYSAGSTSDGSGDYIIDRTTSTNELASLKVANTNKFGFQKRDNSGNGLGGPVTSTSINTSSFQLIDYMRVRGSQFRIFYNGTREDSTTDNVGDITPPAPRIGTHQTGSNGLRGYISELAIYGVSLNDAQRIIVENYLAAKYGLTLKASSIKFAYGSTYGYEVAGIGMQDASNFHLDARGSGIVRINNPSALDPGDYLMWGHDSAPLGPTQTTDIPTTEGVQARMVRIWRVTETGETGTVDISFDLTGLGPVTVSDLCLLIDKTGNGFADETFAAGTIINGATSVGGNVYKFSGVNLNDSWRFTLGTLNISETPLPVRFLNFTATPSSGKVLLKWETAAEINNDYFTIQRSPDGIHFDSLGFVDGAGSSTSKIKYSYVDNYPFHGISYYRLKQTDLNGQFTYSRVIVVNLPRNENNRLSIYPNPAKDYIAVSGDASELKEIGIFSIDGHEVKSLTTISRPDATSLLIDISALPPGMYIIRTLTLAKKLIKQQ